MSVRESFQSARTQRGVGLALAVWCAAGCGTEFDPGSELSGLRVLAVKKSAPYARPGERVELELAWHDTEAPRAGGSVPEIAWVALCQNPPGDLFEQCFTALPELSEAELAERISLPEPGATTANDRFAFTVADDIISSRPPPPDPAAPRYGLNIVFFAACAGRLYQRDPADGFPFGCYEELDGEPGLGPADRQLGSSDFVVGYTSVFAYQDLRNQNPRIGGLEFAGVPYVPAGSDGAASPAGSVALSPPDLCIGDACLGAPLDPGASCPEALTLEACSGDCETRSVRPLIDPDNAEVDAIASRRSSVQLGEQMWVNYYAASGEVDEEVRLLNDATRGWNPEFGTDYQAGSEPGVSYLWAVAHDNRGGVEWARLRLCITASAP